MVLETIFLIFGGIFFLGVLASAIKIVKEYERAVIFRLGRLSGVKGPGIFFIIPLFDKMNKVDLRTVVGDVPKQRLVTKDNISVDVDAVVYYRVFAPELAITKVEDFVSATNLLSQTTLRDVLGQVELDYLLQKRDELNKKIQLIIDEVTEAWGIKVTGVNIRDVSLPDTMLRAIAKQAESERERRSRIIMAEGEQQASQKMTEAARQYQKEPAAMRLRELQTLAEIAREKNLIVVSGGGEIGTVAGLTAAMDKAKKNKKSPDE